MSFVERYQSSDRRNERTIVRAHTHTHLFYYGRNTKSQHTSLRIKYILSPSKHKKVSTFHVELAVINNFEKSKKGNGKEAEFIDINVS